MIDLYVLVTDSITEHGKTLFLECTGSFTKEVTIQFLQVLQAEERNLSLHSSLAKTHTSVV